MKFPLPTIHAIMLDEMFMQRAAWGETDLMAPARFYGFRPDDVAEILYPKARDSEEFWFRLKDGRVFDARAKSCDPASAFYDK